MHHGVGGAAQGKRERSLVLFLKLEHPNSLQEDVSP